MSIRERIRYEDAEETTESTMKNDYRGNGRKRRPYYRNRKSFGRKRFRVEVLLCDDVTSLQIPEKKTSGSAGYDLKSVDKITIGPGEICHKIRTGVKMKIPYGTVGLLSVRSSVGNKGLILTNSPGVIDSDYRGEIFGTVVNISKEPINIDAGEGIFQILFVPIRIGDMVNVPEFSPDKFVNERGEGGYGSTNKIEDVKSEE